MLPMVRTTSLNQFGLMVGELNLSEDKTMQQLQRDLGRVEAKVEIMTDDLKSIKNDIEDIKTSLTGTKAVKDFKWSTLLLVGTLSAVASHIINWIRPFFS